MFQGEIDSKHSEEKARADSDSFADCEDVTSFEKQPTKNGVSEDIPTKIKENEGIVLNNMHVKKNFDEIVDQFKRALQSPISVKSEIQNVRSENVITSDKADESKSIDVDYDNATQDNKGQREKSNDSLVVSSNTDDKVVQCPVDGNVTNNIKNENEIKYFGRDLPSQEQMDVLNESANGATLINVSDSCGEESSPKRAKQFTFSDSDLPDDDEIKDILMLYPKPTFIESFSESESESSSKDESNRPIYRRRRNKPEPVDLTKMLEKLPEKVLTRLRKQPSKLGIEDNKNNSTILKPTYLPEQENEIDEDIIAENIKRFKAFGKRNTNKDSKKQKSVKEKKIERSFRKKAVNKSNEHKKNIKVKPKRKNAKSKSKSNARKNAELKINNTKNSLVSMSAAKITNRSMKNENDGKNTQNKRILLGNRNKKTNCKQKLTNVIERSRLAENNVRRSKRQQKTKQKTDNTVKAPISILKKSIHEQSTVYNISSSSSESPKGLKRSLVDDDSDVPSPKRTRFQNTNNKKELNNNKSRVKKTQHSHLTAFHGKEFQQDKRGPYEYLAKHEPAQKQIRMLNSNRNSLNMKKPAQKQIRLLNSNTNSLNMKTRSQSARRRSHRTCHRTRDGVAR